MINEGAAFHAIVFTRKTFSGQRRVDRHVALKLSNTDPPNTHAVSRDRRRRNKQRETTGHGKSQKPQTQP